MARKIHIKQDILCSKTATKGFPTYGVQHPPMKRGGFTEHRGVFHSEPRFNCKDETRFASFVQLTLFTKKCPTHTNNTLNGKESCATVSYTHLRAHETEADL
eukprot:2388467-Amphidinium_carterae.2